MQKIPCVYILASGPRETLYIGVTSNLPKRLWEHRTKAVAGFTEKYHVDTLVWYEVHAEMMSAIKREKELKSWKRIWKIQLIEKTNSSWKDLYAEVAN